METNELMAVKQLPILEQRLKDLKQYWDGKAAELDSMVCAEETVQACKAARAEFRKEYADVEEQKKAVVAAVMEPVRQFEAIYQECVKGPYAAADARAKAKINAVEAEQKRRCEDELKEYFCELCAAHHVEWLWFGASGVKIGLTEAKQKSHKKLKEQLADFVEGVSADVNAISTMENAPEVLTEYKVVLDLARAVSTIQERHRRIEQEKAALAASEEIRQREAEAVAKVEAAIQPPVVMEPSVVADNDPIFERFKFECFNIKKSQLLRVRALLDEMGVQYK